MRDLVLFGLAIALMMTPAFANVARQNITAVSVQLYGVYITDDPSCQTDLLPAIALKATPTTSNFVANPILGTATIPQKISCVVLVMGNGVQMSYASSNYSGADAVCSSGGNLNVNVCTSVAKLTWPSQITSDAQAAGLNLANLCGAAPTGNEVVPVFMSLNSQCSGNLNTDAGIGGCVSGGKPTTKVALPPTATNSTGQGARLINIPVNGRVVFVVDPDQVISGASGTCSVQGPPLFTIHQ